jgi:carbamoyltransferase
MVVIGINPGIDSTAVLLKDGRILAAIAEERLSRRKLHYGFPRRAIAECLRIGKVDSQEVDRLVFSYHSNMYVHPSLTKSFLEKDWSPFEKDNEIPVGLMIKTFWEYIRSGGKRLFWPKSSDPIYFIDNEVLYKKELEKLGITRAKIEHFDHHECHAASAYWCSGLTECLVVTADGAGDLNWSSVSLGRSGKLEKLLEVPRQTSVGILYLTVTKFLGFRPHRHEGKVTGLAAFGNPNKHIGIMKEAVSLTRDGKFIRKINVNPMKIYWLMFKRLLKNRFIRHPEINLILDHLESNLHGFRKEDVAASVQIHTEDLLSNFVKRWLELTKQKKVALAGGIFANVLVNQRIAELPGVEKVYVQPNMGDGGTALGAAILTWQRFLEEQRKVLMPKYLTDVYLGPEYSDKEVEMAIRRAKLSGKAKRVKNIERIAAEAVAKGKIVGWFQGRMEFGPRALGNRSLLALPTDRNINQTLNDRLKRTEFMPFAPSMLAEDAKDYIKYRPQSEYPSRFMTITFDCTAKAKKQTPAVVHVDGTTRPQIVDKKTNHRYHKLISEYKKLTGLSSLVNTSFNIHEEPIVCSPDDAIRSYKLNSCDALAMENWWIE